MEEEQDRRLTRRGVMAKGAVIAGAAWVAPMIVSEHLAAAATDSGAPAPPPGLCTGPPGTCE